MYNVELKTITGKTGILACSFPARTDRNVRPTNSVGANRIRPSWKKRTALIRGRGNAVDPYESGNLNKGLLLLVDAHLTVSSFKSMNSVDTSVNPVAAMANPDDKLVDPAAAMANPVDKSVNPATATVNPVASLNNPADVTANHVVESTKPGDATAYPGATLSSPESGSLQCIHGNGRCCGKIKQFKKESNYGNPN